MTLIEHLVTLEANLFLKSRDWSRCRTSHFNYNPLYQLTNEYRIHLALHFNKKRSLQKIFLKDNIFKLEWYQFLNGLRDWQMCHDGKIKEFSMNDISLGKSSFNLFIIVLQQSNT